MESMMALWFLRILYEAKEHPHQLPRKEGLDSLSNCPYSLFRIVGSQ
jgi:hypothetical protein